MKWHWIEAALTPGGIITFMVVCTALVLVWRPRIRMRSWLGRVYVVAMAVAAIALVVGAPQIQALP